MLAGQPTEALRHADEVVRSVARGDATPALLALVHRVRGYALLQLADFDGAEQCLDESVRVARAGASSYELALSLEAAARLRQRVGGDGEAEARETVELLDALGVASTPEVPLQPISTG